MKSYLSLIPISARVRRRQNRLTILCIVTAVFLVTAIFSVADMMLRTQTGPCSRKKRQMASGGHRHHAGAGCAAGRPAGRGAGGCRSSIQ